MNISILRAAVETNEYDNILIAKENYDLILNHYKVRYNFKQGILWLEKAHNMK